MAASSCAGGDSGVRKGVEFTGALLTDSLHWSVDKSSLNLEARLCLC